MNKRQTGLCFANRNRDTILLVWIFHHGGRYIVIDLQPGSAARQNSGTQSFFR